MFGKNLQSFNHKRAGGGGSNDIAEDQIHLVTTSSTCPLSIFKARKIVSLQIDQTAFPCFSRTKYPFYLMPKIKINLTIFNSNLYKTKFSFV